MLKSGHLVELYDDLAGDGTATREEFVQIIFCWIPRGPLKVMKRYTAAVLGTHRGGEGEGEILSKPLPVCQYQALKI